MEQNSNADRNDVIYVKKTSGDEEPFISQKLEGSLLRAGADRNTAAEIVKDIEFWINNGVSTRKIYDRAFSILRRKKIKAALRYKLKQAIMDFGPSGFPFEHFIGEIFSKQGYDVQVGQIISGLCITHEVDVIATNDNVQHLVECKYSRDQEKHVSIQVALYVNSRMNDIIKKRSGMPEYSGFTFSGWVVSNKRFSSDSIDYAACSGLKLLGWDYPQGNGLKDIIERLKLFPVTILNHLTRQQKIQLIGQGIVTTNQLKQQIELLDQFRLSNRIYGELITELNDICS